MTDFYQSPADKLRFEILLKSLREGSLNLAIVGDDEVALANYGRQIFDHLKDAGEENVEWWSSADSEKLVQRFNDILSELTVDEALDKSQKRSPKRYMIFPDTHAIQDFELQLLARLINGFPTSNINLVLVVNQHDPYEEKLAVFGKNLLQWILESEHPPSAKAPRRSNRIETMDESPKASPEESKDAIADFSATFAATLASGKFPGPGESKGSSLGASGIGDVSPNDKSSFDPLMDSPGQGGPNLIGPDREEKGSLSSKVAGILIFAILLTVTAFGLIYKDEVAKEAQSLQDFVSGKKPATAKTATPTKAVPNDPGASAATPPTAETATTPPAAADGATPVAGTPSNAATASPSSPVPGVVPTAPTSAPSTNPSTTPATAVAPASTTSTAAAPTPVTNSVGSAPASPRPNSPSTPPSAVGMSSSVKVPVKTDDSLIPNKEVLIVPKAPTTAPATATATNTAQSGATNVASNNAQGVNAKVVPPIATTPGATPGQLAGPTVTPKPDTKIEIKPEPKAEPKAESKQEVRDVKPTPKELPKESPKESPKENSRDSSRDKEKREARDTREAKPAAKTVVAKTNEPLPKLDPKSDKADRAEKSEESKPKSASSDSPSGFRPRPEDQRWVQGLPEDGWVMQHAALDSLEEAKSFQQSSPFYRDAKVMYTKRKDAPPYYIVVTGPYPSRQDAESETRKHPIMAKSWVRSARSLKNQFED